MISWLLFKVWSIWSLRQAKMTLLLHRNKGSKSFWSDSVSLFDRGLDDFCIRNLFLFITFHVTTQTDMRISRLDRGCVVFLCTIVKPSFKLFIYIVNKLDSGCISIMRIFYLNFWTISFIKIVHIGKLALHVVMGAALVTWSCLVLSWKDCLQLFVSWFSLKTGEN